MTSTDDISLGGRRIVVMGASCPAGRAVAVRFAERGAALGLTTATGAAVEAVEVQKLARRLTEQGHRAVAESVDLSSGANVQVAMRQLSKALSGVDTLIIASDLAQEQVSQRVSDADWSRLIGQNLGSVFYAARAAYREMAQREPDATGLRGRVVVIVPAVADEAGAVYRAARAGLEGLVIALQDEWAAAGISIALLTVASLDDQDAAAADDTAGVVLGMAVAPPTLGSPLRG